jgi:hypothetical protein
MPMGMQAPHFPSQQYSLVLHDFVPHATPAFGLDTVASWPPSSEPGATGEENSDDLSSSDPHAARTNVSTAQKTIRIAFPLV